MSKDIYDAMINPTRMRIVQVFASQEKKTATELCEIISDVPRTTLYRHVNIVIDAHVLTVVEERKVRGSVERTLSLNTGELNKHNTMEDVPKKVFTFLITSIQNLISISIERTLSRGTTRYFSIILS